MTNYNYWCSNCGNRKTTDTDHRPRCGTCKAHPVMKAQGREDTRLKLPHPMQPVADDGNDVLRFKPNAIVRALLDEGKIDMNQIAVRDFFTEDRVQFAQLIGYSLSGFGELSYVDDLTYDMAEATAGVTPSLSAAAKVIHLTHALQRLLNATKEREDVRDARLEAEKLLKKLEMTTPEFDPTPPDLGYPTTLPKEGP